MCDEEVKKISDEMNLWEHSTIVTGQWNAVWTIVPPTFVVKMNIEHNERKLNNCTIKMQFEHLAISHV